MQDDISRSEWSVLAVEATKDHPYWIEKFSVDINGPTPWTVSLATLIAAPSGPCWTIQGIDASTETAADEAAEHLRSCIDPHHPGYAEAIAKRPGPVTSNPTEPVYWSQDPTWQMFGVPDRAAHRLARRAADLLRLAYQPADDTETLDTVIAWAAIADITDVTNNIWNNTHLPTPAEIKTRLGLTVTLTPAGLVAAAWQLHRLVAEGWSTPARQLVDDVCQVATRTRVRALSRWLAAGRSLADLRGRSAQSETVGDAHPAITLDAVWLAYEAPQEDIGSWRRAMAELGLAETAENIAGLAVLWHRGISPQTMLTWHRMLGGRTDIRIWWEIVVPLIEYGVDVVDLTGWLDHHKIETALEHTATILETARTGWMSASVRDIPWAVREDYRTRQDLQSGGGQHMITPLEVAHRWFPLYRANPTRHQQIHDILAARAEDDDTDNSSDSAVQVG